MFRRPLAAAVLLAAVAGGASASAPARAEAAARVPSVRTVCVVSAGAARLAVFDVDLSGPRAVTIRRGKRNRVTGGAVVGPLPTRFTPGTTRGALRIRFSGTQVTWRLGGTNVRVAAASLGCARAGATPAAATPYTAPVAAPVPARPIASPLAAPVTPVVPVATPAPAPVVAPVLRAVFGAATFWNALLPGTSAYATGAVNPAAGQELQSASLKLNGSSNTRLNARTGTAPVTLVDAAVAPQPVRLCVSYPSACVPAGSTALAATLAAGVAIPPGFTTPTDADGLAVLHQQDWAGGTGRTWELRGLRRNPDYVATAPVSATNAVWLATGGGLLTGTAEQGGGRFTDGTSGVLGSGLPLIGTEIRAAECAAATISHTVGLSVPTAGSAFVWPATRSNGVVGSTSVLRLGMRLRFPAGAVKPTNLTGFGSALWDAAQKYGFVIDDRTGSTLNVRAEPACATTPLYLGNSATTQLRSFPWADLRVLAEGSDATPTP